MPIFTDTILIAAPPDRVWHALTDPEASRLWRGAEFVTDWRTGSPLLVRRSFGIKTIEDHGRVVLADSPNQLTLSILPSISHLPDRPENYSSIDMVLVSEGNRRLDQRLEREHRAEPLGQSARELFTKLTVTHTVPDPPPDREKAAASGLDMGGERHVAFYWRSTLPLLRDLIEGRPNVTLDLARKAAVIPEVDTGSMPTLPHSGA